MIVSQCGKEDFGQKFTKMKKILVVLYTFTILCSCEDRQPTTVNQNQIDFLKSKIEYSKSELNNKVYETGASPGGIKLIEISEQLTAKTAKLISKISNEEKIKLSDIRELEETVQYKNDTIPLDTAFLHQAFNSYNSNNNSDFITSLLIFNLSTINNIRDIFHSYFFDVDFFKPVVVSDNFTIKKGETFKGSAISQAKMIAIKYLYEIDDPQTEEGFIELPSWASNDYNGIINIKGKELGTHKIKIKSIHTLNGEDKEFDGEFEITVIE